ncbi:MAG: SRPBCC domain-containing protein [Spirochaetes bacterium]|nr:SRPBCC domain-containing protein [Spirochaetota bacterium]
MNDTTTARASVDLKASAEKVWDALTDPAKIKQYLFGTDTECDWRVGSRIYYRGEWEGKHYEDKGEILEIEFAKKIVMTYWSGFSGLADIPENYHRITYRLETISAGTRLSVVQENHRDEATRDHSAANWKLVLEGLRKLVEV